MRKTIAILTAVAMLIACCPLGLSAMAAEPQITVLEAVRTLSFNPSGEILPNPSNTAQGGDVILTSAGTAGWEPATVFTDTDGTQTSVPSLSGSPFGSARHALMSFAIPSGISTDDIKSVKLSLTVKNIKQVSAGNRLAIYGNSIAGTWSLTDSGLLGKFGSTAGSANLANFPLLGLTEGITVGNSTGETVSDQTISLESEALTDYVRSAIESGTYQELTFRAATSLGGVRIYSKEYSAYPPTLTIEYGKAAQVTVNYKAGDTSLGSKELTGLFVDYSYTLTEEEAPTMLMQSGVRYLRAEKDTPVTITPDTEQFTYDIPYNAVTVSEIAARDAQVYVGAVPSLPQTAQVTFSDSQTMTFPIIWDQDEIDAAVDAAGTYTLHGRIDELSDETVEITLTVKEFSPNESVLTNSGGWNWYVEPSGTHIQPGDALTQRYQNMSTGGYEFKHDRTYMGWVEIDGSIVVGQYDHDTDEYTTVKLHDRLEIDDHNNPAVIVLPDGRIMAWYSMHTNEPYMYYRVTKNPEDISEWSEEQYYYTKTEVIQTTYNATYPTAFIVDVNGEDQIYLFWRGVHWMPTMAQFSMPDENGVCKVILGQTQIVDTSDGGNGGGGGRRPYAKYDYDYDRGIIHCTYTLNHPDNERTANSIYYMYIDIAEQAIYTAKGTKLQDVPKNNEPVTSGHQWGIYSQQLKSSYPELTVFDTRGENRRGWTWDIKTNEKGEPCIVYVDITDAAPDANGNPPAVGGYYDDPNADRAHHYYYYARWDSETEQWVNTFLTYGGKWFHENTSQEQCYSGGLTLDHNASDANVVYMAVPTQGRYGNIFEIYRWESGDHGATWEIQEPLTQNSKINNARPNVIYNYKQNDDGTQAGPRVLWVRGEYRYWMNYEYYTGVVTDFAGITPHDDPEMKADAELCDTNGDPLSILTPDLAGTTLMAKFRLSNISIGEGRVKLALGHYSADGVLKQIVTEDVDVPNRSVPQIPVLGAPKGASPGISVPEGSEEIDWELLYVPEEIKEGDAIRLFAWNNGYFSMQPVISIPCSITTAGDDYLMRETFQSNERIVLDEGTEFNGWKAHLNHPADGGYTPSFGTKNYVDITHAPFGNTALHIYRGTSSTTTGSAEGAGGLLVSHALPETDEDYIINFNIRWINELDWNHNGCYNGFSLTNGVTTGHNDYGTSSTAAWQFRYVGRSSGTNGRRGYYISYDTTDYFQGTANTRIDYVDGTIGNNSDRIMEGALVNVKLIVRPMEQKIEFTMNDGYRTAGWTQDYNTLNEAGSVTTDWTEKKINTITFNSGVGYKGELYIDDFSVRLLGDTVEPEPVPEGKVLSIASVTASQEPEAENSAANAIDGDTSTYWSASSTFQDNTPELIADLGSVYTLTSVGIQPIAYTDGRTLRYDIYVSEDGDQWERIFRGTCPGGAMKTHDARLLRARYVKVRTNGSSINNWFSVAELEVKGMV